MHRLASWQVAGLAVALSALLGCRSGDDVLSDDFRPGVAIIYGRVSDPQAAPVAGARVTFALPTYVNAHFDTVATDEAGEYRYRMEFSNSEATRSVVVQVIPPAGGGLAGSQTVSAPVLFRKQPGTLPPDSVRVDVQLSAE